MHLSFQPSKPVFSSTKCGEVTFIYNSPYTGERMHRPENAAYHAALKVFAKRLFISGTQELLQNRMNARTEERTELTDKRPQSCFVKRRRMKEMITEAVLSICEGRILCLGYRRCSENGTNGSSYGFRKSCECR